MQRYGVERTLSGIGYGAVKWGEECKTYTKMWSRHDSIGYGAAQLVEECKTGAKMWSRYDSIWYGVVQLLSAQTNTFTRVR